MIEILPPEEAAKLDPVFEEAWNARVPDPRHSSILAEVEEGELIAFIPLEDVILVSGVYVAPNHRGRRGVRAIRELFARIEMSARGSGRSFLMARHENRANHFAGYSRRLGFKQCGDAVFRTDF